MCQSCDFPDDDHCLLHFCPVHQRRGCCPLGPHLVACSPDGTFSNEDLVTLLMLTAAQPPPEPDPYGNPDEM